MHTRDYLEIGIFLLVLTALTPILGKWMAGIYQKPTGAAFKCLGWLERACYCGAGVDAERGMGWKEYLAALLWFNFLGFLLLFVILLAQGIPLLNPQGIKGLGVWLAFNTAVSFVTNTNWQAYSGEAQLSYLSQMVGLGVQNFVSAGTGMAVAVALARGLAGREIKTVGNFWADMTRSVVYILLPLCLVFAVFLVSQGVVQGFGGYVEAKTLEGAAQMIPQGPAASQIAIKQLGTNGGGFFGVNSAHPFENPTPLSNFFQVLSILLIPSAFVIMYGHLVENRRQGWSLWWAMMGLLLIGLVVALWSEFHPALPGEVMMEGKEVRFGVANSVLWGVATTAASNGSVNAMHDSFSPLAGLVCLFNLKLGEIIFGGVGAGLYGMIMFVLLTVFLAGLMVGRTPEYLGKKIGAREIIWAVAAILIPNVCVLGGSALAVLLPAGTATLTNAGPHGLSEILYAFASASGNNGSAFGGLGADNPFYNTILAICMLLGRFGVIIPALAIAGAMGAKKTSVAGPGTFPTTGPLFVGLLIAVILIVGGLTYMPALSLGPIMDHLLWQSGRTF
ncbi:MAG: potassium-transporting ATPase subunit KdpA [Verrucomicrobiae bacterium]|nr:potassium-transporting ATPase subunit KdpA [Verrucomicrobiae bacterium]